MLNSSILTSIKGSIPPVHPEGHKFILAFALVTLVIGWFFGILFWPLLALTLWCALFFRDPERTVPVDHALVLSPADGRVSSVVTMTPPDELDLGDEPMVRISVFMNVFNCHVNRMPIDGRIERIIYTPGAFVNAELDKASERNERNALVIKADRARIGVVQIAGLVARRILCWSEEGETLSAGDRFGLIRFGSRLDIYVPQSARINVSLGQTAIAGETVLAELGERASDTKLVRIV